MGTKSSQRVATGIFTYTKPKDQIQRNHNKEALAILETKRSQMVIEMQAINTGHIPQHRIKYNFLDFYQNLSRRMHGPATVPWHVALAPLKTF